MGFFADFKAKRAAKKAQALFDLQLNDWNLEHQALLTSLDIFTGAAKGDEPEDNQLVQKAGELVLWSGSAVFHEAGRTPSRYVGSSQGFSIPIVAGVRYRVSSNRGTLIPGEEMQMEKEVGLVKLTNQRLIFAGPIATTEWAFAKLLSTFSNAERTDFIFGVSNRQKSSGLRFSPEDGYTFAHLFAMGLHSYENGIPATIEAIQNELKEGATDKPKLELPPTM